jgi:DNA repair exonuclease SbcCD ATPase subunit
MKANVALKAGLDGLRTFKAAAEMNQQKLLQRYDALKIELREAEEAVARHHLATTAGEALATSESRGLALEARLNTQAELIQSLEADLKSARLLHRSDDEKHQEMERLAKELTTKNQIIERLQTDADEQQRKLSKLRGSESETVRLKAITDRDRSEIDALQREVAQLRSALVRHGAGDGTVSGGDHGDLQAKLKEREHSVAKLMGTIKEQEATIKKLNEAAESWKRKYQFLASDSPDAYQVAAEK